MSRKPLEEGQRFGKLRVTLETNGVKGCRKKYKCICDCGNTTWSTKGQLESGTKNSCGCMVKVQPDPVQGQRFYRLTATGRDNGEVGNRKKYECICDCGKVIWTQKLFLYRGDTKSCGCWKKEVAIEQIKKNQPLGNLVFKELKKNQRDLIALLPYIDPDYSEEKKAIIEKGFSTTNKIHILCSKCGSKHIINITSYITAKGDLKRKPLCVRCQGHHTKEEDLIIQNIRKIYKGTIIENWRGLKCVSSTGKKTKQEIDIYLPEIKLGIEYNSNYYHSDKTKNFFYHFNKYKQAKKQEILLFSIWEEDLNEFYLEQLNMYISYLLDHSLYSLPFKNNPRTIKVCNDFPLDLILEKQGYSFIEYRLPKSRKLYKGTHIYNSGYSIFRKD